MVAKVFISYRRDDSAGHAGRLHDRLEREFGRDLPFMDVDAIPLGADFVDVLIAEVAKCDVLLAIIGPNWVDSRDEEGRRRLDGDHDYVRIEIGAALKRGIPVVPILLEGTRVPKPEQLPDDLKGLVRRQGLEVRHATFHADMDKLVPALKAVGTPVDPHITPNSPSTPRPPPLPPRAFLPSASEQITDRSTSGAELVRQFEVMLLEALGLGPSALERLREPGIAGQALAAAHALKLQAPTHHGLNEQLKLVEGENKRALENAHGTLAAHFADDDHALDLLKESAAEINRLLPALTLLPVFNRLVKALEEALAENALTGDVDLLLKRLRKLKSELDTMDWSNRRAWNLVRRHIDHLNEAGPAASIAAVSGGKLH